VRAARRVREGTRGKRAGGDTGTAPVGLPHLYGAYLEVDEEYPVPRWGHPKDRRPDLKQIQAGLAVSGDGGIPVVHRAYGGGRRRWPRWWGR